MSKCQAWLDGKMIAGMTMFFGFLTNLPMELTVHAIANMFTYMKPRKQMVS